MIVEWLASALSSLFQAVASILPGMDVPAWVTGLSASVADLSGYMTPLGNYIPFGAVGQCLALVGVTLGIALAIRIVRILVSLFTGGGGGAA